MIRGWEYRVVTVLGVAGIVALTIVGVTTPLAHECEGHDAGHAQNRHDPILPSPDHRNSSRLFNK